VGVGSRDRLLDQPHACGQQAERPLGRGHGLRLDRNKFVIVGGRAGTGYNYEDTWEWDPTTGAFTDRTNSGSRPPGRGLHSMVFEKSTGKVLLFGGGRSSQESGFWLGNDGTGVSSAYGDTWEWDPVTGAWTELTLAVAPSARYSSALVWDSTRARAVLFGGEQEDQYSNPGIPCQDTWEWDPATPGWTERTADGIKPSARFRPRHGVRSRPWRDGAGGWRGPLHRGRRLGMGSGHGGVGSTSGRQRSQPAPARAYASLVTDVAKDRLYLVDGLTFHTRPGPNGMPEGQTIPFADLWELEPATAAFTSRDSHSAPAERSDFAMAFCPDNNKTYVFGGVDERVPGAGRPVGMGRDLLVASGE